MIGLYEKAARAAYRNSIALLDEARILGERSKFARAYALCILASEEFCKSFLYKGVSTGLASEEDIRKALVKHSEKISRFVHLIITPYLLSTRTEDIRQAREHDDSEPDHSKHLYPTVIAEILSRASHRDEITSIFAEAQDLKMKSLYVDVRERKLIIPDEEIVQTQFERVFGFLNAGLRGFEVILNETDENFHEVARWLDPELRYVLKAKA